MQMNSKLKKIFESDPDVLEKIEEIEFKKENDYLKRIEDEIEARSKLGQFLKPIKGDKGEDGVTPIKGIDYLTPDEVEKWSDIITPKKGVDYFDGEKGEKGDVGPRGPIGLQGEPGISPEITTEDLDSKVLAEKINTLSGEINYSVLKGVPTVKDLVKDIKKGKLLELKDIKGARLDMNDQRWHGSGSSSSSSATWGSITGTLSAQTDLQTALNDKLDVTTASTTYVPYTGATTGVDLGTNAITTPTVNVGNVALIDSSSGLAVVNRSNTSLQTAYFPPDGSLPITLNTDVILGTNASTAAPTTLAVSGLITGDNVNTNTVTSTNSEVQGHLRLTNPGSVLEPSLRFNGEGVGAYSTGSYATQDGTIHFNTFDGAGSGFDIMTLTSDGAGNNPKVTIGGSTAQLDIIGSSQSVVRIGDKVDGLVEFSNSDGTIISSGITSSSLMTQAKVLARSLGA